MPIASSSIQSIITFDSQIYGVPQPLLEGIIKRESGFNQYAVGDHGLAHGLVQIRSDYHPDISLEEAENPVFAINFLASEIASGNCDLWSTCRAAGG